MQKDTVLLLENTFKIRTLELAPQYSYSKDKYRNKFS